MTTNPFNVMFSHVNRPGSGEPGPPDILPFVAPGREGFTDATSNCVRLRGSRENREQSGSGSHNSDTTPRPKSYGAVRIVGCP